MLDIFKVLGKGPGNIPVPDRKFGQDEIKIIINQFRSHIQNSPDQQSGTFSIEFHKPENSPGWIGIQFIRFSVNLDSHWVVESGKLFASKN